VHTIASSHEDTEITLGVGKLLGLFFLLTAICGIFFSIGYSLGKSAGREQALNDQPAQSATASDSAADNNAGGGKKPSAGVAMKSDAAPAEDANPANQQSNLTFYKAVQQNDTAAQPAAAKTAEPAPAKAAPEAAPAPKVGAAATPAPATAQAATAKPTAPAARGEVISHTSPVTGPGTIVVQIAAVSREDDAVALAGALRKKNYNVFVVNNPVNNDKFYHVQVGPFSTMEEAQAMKAKLVAEGYNPIIKK